MQTDEASLHGSQQGPRVNGGTAQLMLAIVAALGCIGSIAWLMVLLRDARGCNVGCPPVLQDPSQPHETLMQVLAGSQLLWAALGATALVLGIRSWSSNRRSAWRSALAVVVSLVAPIGAGAIFLAATL